MLTLIVLAWIALTALAVSFLAWWIPEEAEGAPSEDPIKRSLESFYSSRDSTKRLLESEA